MRIVHFEKAGVAGIAADDGSGWHGLTAREGGFPGTLPELIAQGADLLRTGKDLLPMPAIDLNAVRILPPVPKPPKILCVGLNYDDHLEESGLKKPVYPEIFARFFAVQRCDDSRFSTAHAAMDDGQEFRRHRGIRPLAGDARCPAAGCTRVAHSGPIEWPSDAGFAYRPAHFQRPRADRNDQRPDESGAR